MKRWTLPKSAVVAGVSTTTLANWYVRDLVPRQASRLTVADAVLAGLFSELSSFSPLPVARERSLVLLPELGRVLASALRGETPEIVMATVGEIAGEPDRLALHRDVVSLNSEMAEVLARRGRLHVVPLAALIVRAGLAQMELDRAAGGPPLPLPEEALC